MSMEPGSPPPAKITAESVVQAIRRDMIRETSMPQGAFFTEITHPTLPTRIDGLYIHADGTTTAYEVKVSRSDVIAELRQPEKSQAWAALTNKFCLVLGDESLAAGFLTRPVKGKEHLAEKPPRSKDLGLKVPDGWWVLTPPTKDHLRKLVVLQEGAEGTPGNPAALLGRIALRTRADREKTAYNHHRELGARYMEGVRDGRHEGSSSYSQKALDEWLEEIGKEARKCPAEEVGADMGVFRNGTSANIFTLLRQEFFSPANVVAMAASENSARTAERIIDNARSSLARSVDQAERLAADAKAFLKRVKPPTGHEPD